MDLDEPVIVPDVLKVQHPLPDFSLSDSITYTPPMESTNKFGIAFFTPEPDPDQQVVQDYYIWDPKEHGIPILSPGTFSGGFSDNMLNPKPFFR